MYNLQSFQCNFRGGKKGFQVAFADTTEVAHFTWKFIIERPTEFMFFGPPLSSTRSYDDIFKNTQNLDSLFHLFVCYHDCVLGDVNAYLALQNAYVSRRNVVLEKQLSEERKSAALTQVSGGMFRNSRTKEFLAKVDLVCEWALLSACTQFQI